MMNLMEVRQYWSTHIWLSAVLMAASIASLLTLRSFLLDLPRNAIPFLATVFSTLLGLTFTTFAIFTAFMPNLRIDFVKTNTFLNQGKTFRITIYLELVSLVFTFLDYILYGSAAFVAAIYLTMILVIWSMGFFYLLVDDTFRLFKSARDHIIKQG